MVVDWVVVVGWVVVVVDWVVVGAVVVVVGAVVVVVEASVVVMDWVVVDWTGVAAVALLEAAAPPAVGPDGRTVVPATAGRTAIPGLGRRATDVRTVVVGLGVAATTDEGTLLSTDAGVTDSSEANEDRSIVVEVVVVDPGSSNWRAPDWPPDSPLQPTATVRAATKSPTGTRRVRPPRDRPRSADGSRVTAPTGISDSLAGTGPVGYSRPSPRRT